LRHTKPAELVALDTLTASVRHSRRCAGGRVPQGGAECLDRFEAGIRGKIRRWTFRTNRREGERYETSAARRGPRRRRFVTGSDGRRTDERQRRRPRHGEIGRAHV